MLFTAALTSVAVTMSQQALAIWNPLDPAGFKLAGNTTGAAGNTTGGSHGPSIPTTSPAGICPPGYISTSTPRVCKKLG